MSSIRSLSLFAEPVASDAPANRLAAARALAIPLARSRPLDRRLVAQVMTTAFGASDVDGAWSWRDAYDAIEAATVMQIRRLAAQVGRLEDAPAEIAALLAGVSALGLTHSRRSEEQVALDQFSTPPELAALVVLAAQVRPGDIVLEPSAGTGLMAVVAEACGAVLTLNEIAPGHLPGAWLPDQASHQLVLVPDDREGAVRLRRGFFLGDGTGCGKGRQIAAVIADNMAQGRVRAVWLSRNDALLEDARRDWAAIGGGAHDLVPLGRWKQADAIRLDRGILFTTYATLRQSARGGRPSRLDQIVAWLGAEFDGVVAFDEAHAMANAAGGGKGARGAKKASLQGMAGLALQNRLPDARVLYVSATGATTAENLAYASRLGLWGGPDAPFMSRADFLDAMDRGGVAAMELVARELKALGLYVARSLSFEGVEYEPLIHPLAEDDIGIWDAWADAFQLIHANLAEALKAVGISDDEGKPRSPQAAGAVHSAFEGAKLRFFGHLLAGLTHPFVRTAVKGYAAMHDRFRTSVQGTARSYLKWLAGDDLERALSTSDFALGDLTSAQAPVSLYVQVAPADAAALRPLVRLLFYAAAQALTVHETEDAVGRPKRHRLLMLMDEFPLLGRVSFFEKSLRLLSGYGVKVMFVAQSLNDIVETYGPNSTILDNCAVYTAFSALDPLTQDKVSKLTGTIGETRESRSTPAGFASGRSTVSRSQTDRPLLEPGEVRALPDDLQLIFVAGQRPLRTRKLQYDRRRPFRERADAPPPDQAVRIDAPPPSPHPWAGRRSLGEDSEATLPLFKEIVAAMDDKKVAARAADIYGRVAQEMAAQDAALDHLKGQADG